MYSRLQKDRHRQNYKNMYSSNLIYLTIMSCIYIFVTFDCIDLFAVECTDIYYTYIQIACEDKCAHDGFFHVIRFIYVSTQLPDESLTFSPDVR